MQRTWSSVAERPDASMSLLREVVEGADDGYAEAFAAAQARQGGSAHDGPDHVGPDHLGPDHVGPDPAGPHLAGADRRAHSQRPRRPWWGRAVSLLLLLGLGLVAGQAIATARVKAPAVADGQQRLRDDVARQTSATDALAASVTRLQTQVTALQAARGAETDDTDELTRLRVAVGTVAVHGPGVVVHLDDAAQPPADQVGAATDNSSQQADDGRVHDHELQAVANQLWAAGAEAISINGLRLTPRTAIREAGQAILVDFRPLSPPYTVRAVGDPQALQTNFASSDIARKLQTYVAVLGLSYDLSTAKSLSLPAGGNPALREVQVAPPTSGNARHGGPGGATGSTATTPAATPPDPSETP